MISVNDNVINVRKVNDFLLDCNDLSLWDQTDWIELLQLETNKKSQNLKTRVKTLYSNTGIYFFFECEDHYLNASFKSDFKKLWLEDVVEVFLWPDINQPVYFEYEISPLNFELPLLVSNNHGELLRWIPYMYEDNRKTRHYTFVEGGPKQSGSSITRWSAKFYLPFKLLTPLKNLYPISHTTWRINLYRVDYESNESVKWAWQPVSKTFHEYKKFGVLQFE